MLCSMSRKAGDAMARREALAGSTHASNGIADGIMHRGHPRRRLAPWQRWMNVALAPIRGLVRNGAHLQLLFIALNLRRAERLAA